MLESQILNETDIDLGKLRQFAIRYHIPNIHRIAVWKLLLGISSCYPETKTIIDSHRLEEAQMLLRSLKVMRKVPENFNYSKPSNAELSNTVLAMIKLADSSISLSALGYSEPVSLSQKGLHLIANAIMSLCQGQESLTNAYWITLRLDKILAKIFDNDPNRMNSLLSDIKLHMTKLIKSSQTHTYTSPQPSMTDYSRTMARPNCDSNSPELFVSEAFGCADVMNDEAIKLWFRSGGSLWFSEEPLYRLWDKVASGESSGIINLLKITLMDLLTCIHQQICNAPDEILAGKSPNKYVGRCSVSSLSNAWAAVTESGFPAASQILVIGYKDNHYTCTMSELTVWKLSRDQLKWQNRVKLSSWKPAFRFTTNSEMSEKKVVKKKVKKRTGSEAAQFDQKTIQEFKEAFGIMDQDKDGIIDKNDLKNLYAMIGTVAGDSQIDNMLKEAPGPINFTVFLTLFGERLTGTDPEATILGAFQMWDKADTGFITEEQLVQILKNKRGEPLSESEIEAMYKGKPPISGGKVDYKAFTRQITTGAQEELAAVNA
ncbi:myosin regulatory light chain 1 [Ditylenchus destructor]|nr:myosin regulatory light chain 1 [Ditylenchus destructor]